MKNNKVKNCAKALAEIALEKAAGAERSRRVENFLKYLEKNNLQRRAKEIVALAERYLLEKTGKSMILIETARKITPGQKKLLESVAKSGDMVKELINPDLIAGVKIVVSGNKQIDYSLANKLSKIFK